MEGCLCLTGGSRKTRVARSVDIRFRRHARPKIPGGTSMAISTTPDSQPPKSTSHLAKSAILLGTNARSGGSAHPPAKVQNRHAFRRNGVSDAMLRQRLRPFGCGCDPPVRPPDLLTILIRNADVAGLLPFVARYHNHFCRTGSIRSVAILPSRSTGRNSRRVAQQMLHQDCAKR